MSDRQRKAANRSGSTLPWRPTTSAQGERNCRRRRLRLKDLGRNTACWSRHTGPWPLPSPRRQRRRSSNRRLIPSRLRGSRCRLPRRLRPRIRLYNLGRPPWLLPRWPRPPQHSSTRRRPARQSRKPCHRTRTLSDRRPRPSRIRRGTWTRQPRSRLRRPSNTTYTSSSSSNNNSSSSSSSTSTSTNTNTSISISSSSSSSSHTNSSKLFGSHRSPCRLPPLFRPSPNPCHVRPGGRRISTTSSRCWRRKRSFGTPESGRGWTSHNGSRPGRSIGYRRCA